MSYSPLCWVDLWMAAGNISVILQRAPKHVYWVGQSLLSKNINSINTGAVLVIAVSRVKTSVWHVTSKCLEHAWEKKEWLQSPNCPFLGVILWSSFFQNFLCLWHHNKKLHSYRKHEKFRNVEHRNRQITWRTYYRCLLPQFSWFTLPACILPIYSNSTYTWLGVGKGKIKASWQKQKLEEPICTVCPQTRKSALTRNLTTGTPILHCQTPKLHRTWFLFLSHRSWPPSFFIQDTHSNHLWGAMGGWGGAEVQQHRTLGWKSFAHTFSGSPGSEGAEA